MSDEWRKDFLKENCKENGENLVCEADVVKAAKSASNPKEAERMVEER